MANDAAIKRAPLPRFDHGIERIVRAPLPRHDSTSPHRASEFAPAFTATKPRLEQLFDIVITPRRPVRTRRRHQKTHGNPALVHMPQGLLQR